MIQHLYVGHDIIQYKALDLWCLMSLEQIKMAVCQPIFHEMLIQLYSCNKKKKKVWCMAALLPLLLRYT